MDNSNIFDAHFDRVSESRQNLEDIRSKLIEGIWDLNEIKKIYNSKQKVLTENEVEISKLKTINQQLKVSLMKTLIEKEELLTKKTALEFNIEKLNEQLENMEATTDVMIQGDDVRSFCERHSTTNQLSILNKIQDAKCKLMKYGSPPNNIRL